MANSKRSPQPGGNGAEAELTLLANGSAGPWDVAIDESATGSATWFAHIEGPSVYLYFKIPSLQTVAKARAFLKQRPVKGGALRLGALGTASINLLWDDEYLDRCFLIVGGSGKPSVRLSFSGPAIKDIAEALGQIARELKDDGLL